MGYKRNKKPLLEHIEIIDIGAEGKAIGRLDEKIVFVPGCIPGDVVDVQVNRKRKKYMEGYVTKFHVHSDKKVKPFCQHFGTCGGCKWQMLPYEEQLKYKQKQVVDQLTRIGKIEFQGFENILPSQEEIYYRNKLEYTFSNTRWLTADEITLELPVEQKNALGFHVPGRFDKVLDIEHCYLQSSPSNEIRMEVKNFALENEMDFFDIREQKGLLRNLIIRSSSIGELMVIVVFYTRDNYKRKNLLQHLYNKFPGITSLMYIINEKPNDSIFDQEVKLFRGRDYIVEDLDGLKFRIGAKSFFQTNSKQAKVLYDTVKEFAGLEGQKQVVYDLYTGTGTIANYLARDAYKVVGIETIPGAIQDAGINSDLNNINNTSFFAGDVKDILTSRFIEKHGQPDVVVLDPPRAGLHPTVIETLLETMPTTLVYVSCNPATQARDIQLLKDNYKIERVQPVDMFPHTHHVENVVKMTRK